MFFTIIMPTHDRPLLIKRTLESLIAQTCQDFNVIIVSDSATYLPPYQELTRLDGRFDYVIRRSGTMGPAHSRDLGLLMADGEYIMYLDDDDTFQPTHLASLKARLELDRPEILFTDFQIQNEDRTANPPQALSMMNFSTAAATYDSIFVRNTIPNNCLAFRRDVLQGVRNEPGLVIYEDWDFLLAAIKGRSLAHLAVNTVIIHKCQATAPENLRRGNTREDAVVDVMLQLYKRHPAPNMETRLARQALLANAGLNLDLAYF